MDTIETLLESLNDYAIQSERILQEGSNSIDRILNLYSSLSGSANCHEYRLSEHDKFLISRGRDINPTFDYRISTYSNIHNSKKYDIDASCNVDFVLEAIMKHMQNPTKEFIPKEVNEEAIAKTFKKLTTTGHEYRTLSVDDFKGMYKDVAFGQRKLIIPQPMILARLFERSPYIITHINNKLIFKHINSLKDYYDKVEDKFNKIAKNNPKMSVSLNGYLACLDTAIRNTLIMYKAIRNTFYELNTEYRYIFGELLRIDKELNSEDLNECSINYYKNVSSTIEALCESISSDSEMEVLDESTFNNKNELSKSKLSKKSKSLLDDLLSSIKYDDEIRVTNKADIEDLIHSSGIIFRITNDDLSKINSVRRIYPNILNKIDMNNFISQLDTKIDFCKNQFEKLINNEEQLNSIDSYVICKELMGDLFFWDRSIPEDTNPDAAFQSYLANLCKTKLFGKPIDIKISNLTATFDNIVEVPNYLEAIDNHLDKFNRMVVDIITKLKEIDNVSKIELIITKILQTYNLYSSTISCIYFSLFKFEKYSIELVQNLIDEINLN